MGSFDLLLALTVFIEKAAVIRTGETVLLAKKLPNNHQNLSLIPCDKKPGLVAGKYNPSAGEAQADGFLGPPWTASQAYGHIPDQ